MRIGLGIGINRHRSGAGGGGGATAPAAFTVGQWTVTDAATGGQATVNITALPSDGGSAITALQYSISGGAWTAFSGTGTGARTIGGFADTFLEGVVIRAVNAAGSGVASDTKTVTTTAPVAAPEPFTVPMWAVANAATGGSATFEIITVPDDGGSALTALQYRIGAGAWTAFSGTVAGFYSVGGFTDGAATNVMVRAVNAINPAADSDVKSVTTGAAALDRVVDFISASNAGLFQDNQIFSSGGNLPANGIWVMGFMYYDGTNGSGTLMGGSTISTDTRYLQLQPTKFTVRNSSSLTTPTLASLSTPGWYLVTGKATRFAGDVGWINSVTILRNELTATTTDNVFSLTPASFERITLGYLATLNGLEPNANFRGSGFAAGWGDPTALHAWLYNGGAFGRDIRTYPGDAGVEVRHYWPAARTGDAAFSVSDAGLADAIGTADTWTQQGSPVWSTPAPPFDASIVLATTQSAVVPSGATSTITVTSTIPAGSFGGTPLVDTAKVSVWATKGMGPITVTGASVVVAGLTATTTLDLSRPIYASELIRCNLEGEWLYLTGKVQSAGYADSKYKSAAVTNSSPASDPANWPGISHGSAFGAVGWKFSTPLAAGYHTDGIPWVAPGAVIAEEYPTRTVEGAHGAEQNPARRLINQKFDYQKTDYTGAPPALPWTLADKDTVIKAHSNLFPRSQGEGSSGHPINITAYGALVCRATPPTTHEFAPPICWDTPASRPGGPTIDVTSISFPTYSTSGHPRPTVADTTERMQIFNPAPAIWAGVEERRQGAPTGFSGRAGYPLQVGGAIQAAGLLMIGDDTLANKRLVAKGFIMNGSQWHTTIKNSSQARMEADGGQNQGWILPQALYLGWTGQTAAFATYETDINANELDQAFQITAPLLTIMQTRDPLTTTYHAVGDYEWSVRSTEQLSSNYGASASAPYRSLNAWSGAVLTLKAFGFMHSTWVKMRGVVVRANTQNLPPAALPWPLHHNDVRATPSGTVNWEAAFWADHWASIDAVTQTVG